MRLPRLSAVFAIVTPILACTPSSGPAPNAEARAVVLEYCQLDYDGARLSAGKGERLFSLVTWEAEPGWDTAVIVSSFNAHKAQVIGPSAKVIVDYRVVGRFEGRPPTTLEASSEHVEFQLVKRGDTWLVEHGKIPPHVSLLAFIGHVQTLVQQARNDERQSALLRDLERLRALK